MAAIHDLLAQVQDEALRARLEQEINRLTKQKKFGLVFEEHLPECTPLYDVPVKRGANVAKKTGSTSDMYEVLAIKDGMAACVHKVTEEQEIIPVSDLVCVAQFGEPIYPYLKPLDSVCNAPDSDLWHTLIEADNYHALQLLEYLYAGKVDCIYIDPPYNTGAKDWKYNNDYVDGSDAYRHSKWLSMMEKRLELAKKLLNPDESVLIVTIDEKEYLHLGCLLEEMFPEANMQMISSVINPYGTQRLNEFSRNDEYIFFLMIGSARPVGVKNENAPEQTIWKTFRRGDLASRRGQPKGGKAQFYPIYVDNKSLKIVTIGDPIPFEVDRHNVPQIDGCTAVFPLRDDGTEMNWCVRPESARLLLEKGYIKAGKFNPKTQQMHPISYLRSGTIDDINSGKLIIDGYEQDGSIVAHYQEQKEQMPQTNWRIKEHSARDYGSNLIRSILKDKRFTFPKSVYAVKDCIFLFTKNKPNALIVDFFAGSGTTMHAVNLLNAEDGGHRQCIMVTNNEVSADEAKILKEQGYKPGDKEWENIGIARYVTWPRTVCSIEGHDINGKPLKGNYVGSDAPMSNGFKANATFFKLGFLDKTAVALGSQLAELIPVLWLKAGAHGACPELKDNNATMMIQPENKFAILIDEKQFSDFEEKMQKHPEIQTIYFVTDSDPGYREMIKGYAGKDTYQLYRDYLDNFRINTRR